jgi:Domain of unknown function (DUF4126)
LVFRNRAASTALTRISVGGRSGTGGNPTAASLGRHLGRFHCRQIPRPRRSRITPSGERLHGLKAKVAIRAALVLPIVLGIALAAATGFRVFLPMLIVSAAAYTGHLSLDNSFAWLGTPAAVIMLSVAAVAEILGYYIPVVDNLLDSLATPAAFIAGTVVSAAVMTDVPPMVKWTAAVIAGGGIAGLTQGATAALRAHSTVLTGGLGNPIIATVELGGALLMSFLALMAPAAAVALVILFLWLAIRLLRQVFPGVRSKNRSQ